MKFLTVSIATITLGILGFGYDVSSGYLNFEFSTDGQQNQNWCYAATTKLVFDYYGINKSQTKIVEEIKGITGCQGYANCRDSTDSNECNALLPKDNNWLPYLNSNTGANYQQIPFDVDAIKDAINQKHGPVIVLLSLTGGLSHAVLLNGFYEKKAKWATKLLGKKDYAFFSIVNPGASTTDCTNCKFLIKYIPEKNIIESLVGNSYYQTKTDSTRINIFVPTLSRP